MSVGAVETFTAEERARLAPYFTNVDAPVFALVNLPEVVKGALFARYSRSPKSLRRLFLDEFADLAAGEAAPARDVGIERAERLFERVFVEYGDDSVAQLGGVHLACEGVSNVLTKLLEWGRLMAYLEQSTRYVPYADRPGGRWRYHVPGGGRAGPRSRASSRRRSTSCSRRTPAGSSRCRSTFAAAIRARRRTRRRSTGARSGRRLSTRCGDSCPPRPDRTSGSTAPGRRTRRSCSGCARRRSPRRARARTSR